MTDGPVMYKLNPPAVDLPRDMVRTESCRDKAEWLVAKLKGIRGQLDTVQPAPECAEMPVEKSTQEPGLVALLEECHYIVKDLDRRVSLLLDTVGRL